MPIQSSSVLVLGNGDRGMPLRDDADIVITFNGSPPPHPTHAWVDASTVRDEQADRHRVVLSARRGDSAWLRMALSGRLDATLVSRTAALGCLPSTGFCVMHALWDEFESVHADGVSFDPSLVRGPSGSARKPRPQAFHNWLGERRLSLGRWLEAPRPGWRWSLFGRELVEPRQNQGAAGGNEPGLLLDVLHEAQRSRSLDAVQRFAYDFVRPCPTLLQPTETTMALERCFHLNRLRSDTSNWWLYDTQGSALVDALAARLRQAQWRAFVIQGRNRVSVAGTASS